MTPSTLRSSASNRSNRHRANPWIFLAADIVLVALFAGIGRVSHGEPLAGILGTAAPFWLGLGLGWLLTRAWHDPRRIFWPGLGIWVCTVAGGMATRVLIGQGTQLSFNIVASIANAAFLLGYRWLASLFTRRSKV